MLGTTIVEPRISTASALLRRFGPISVIYFTVLAVTRPDRFGDTGSYVHDILLFDRGSFSGYPNPLWDFGHVCWRPLGWLLYKLFGAATPYFSTGEESLAIATVMIAFTMACGFLSVVLVQSLALWILDGHWSANLVSASFLCFYSFLNYVHTGNAYVSGLCFLLLGLWLTIRGVDHQDTSWRFGLAAGLALGVAVLFWFPYILSFPGVAVTACLSRNGRRAHAGPTRNRLWLIALLTVSASVTIGAGYVIAISNLHFKSVVEFKLWLTSAGHGWSQPNRLIRIISGLPKSFLYMGDDVMKLKQYFVQDPYAQVTFLELIKAYLWRLVLFYAFAGCLLWTLWRTVEGRRILAIFTAAALPVFWFAGFVFESGSPERYLPLYPFLCLALAYCLSRFPKPVLAQAVVGGFLLAAIFVNAAMLSKNRLEAKAQSDAERVRSLQGRVASGGLVAVVTALDDVYQFTSTFPFDPVNRKQTLPVYDVVEPGTLRVLVWREEFAIRVLKCMKQGESVWVSKRFLAERPDPSWKWAEGDDRRVSWKDLYPVFRSFTYSEDTGGPDGFLRLEGSDPNVARLGAIEKSGMNAVPDPPR